MSRGKTIQIYLTDGEPTGIRTAELTTSISKAVIVPRKRVGEADKRGELRQPGLYFLFGFDDEPRVYIGKSIDCMMRLKQHNGDPRQRISGTWRWLSSPRTTASIQRTSTFWKTWPLLRPKEPIDLQSIMQFSQ